MAWIWMSACCRNSLPACSWDQVSCNTIEYLHYISNSIAAIAVKQLFDGVDFRDWSRHWLGQRFARRCPHRTLAWHTSMLFGHFNFRETRPKSFQFDSRFLQNVTVERDALEIFMSSVSNWELHETTSSERAVCCDEWFSDQSCWSPSLS